MERLVRDKHSSLVSLFVTDEKTVLNSDKLSQSQNFFFVTNEETKKDTAFVLGKPVQPSLTFEGKAGEVCPSGLSGPLLLGS